MFMRTIFITIAIFIFPISVAYAITCDSNQYTDGEYCYTCPANATCDGINFTCVDGWYKNGGICEHCAVENASCTGPDDYVCWAGYYDENGVCNACGGAMTTIGYGSGADDAGDCGRVLHIGDAQVYLRSNQITTPSLIVQYADNLFYGNMSTTERGNLRIQIGDIVYSVYDDSML